jgi:cellulose synthase/poly-beta-1,6-N-acetylglucosamine synthase-like glycosyltransferase
LDYPSDWVDIHVVADNCTDSTADVARDGGATVHERFNPHDVGKGYALQWLAERLRAAGDTFDALVVIDADSQVAPGFLTELDAELQRGARAVQAYYGALEDDSSWAVGLRAAALAAIHYVRPLGRTVLGASIGLKGNGMAFRRELLEAHGWSASVTEDIEYHMTLVLAGERVHFAPGAVVLAEMPGSLRTARTQNVRWEQGRIEMIRRYVPSLVSQAYQAMRLGRWSQAMVSLDAIMEHLIPPFSILMAMNLALLLAAIWLRDPYALGLLGVLLLGQLAYLLSGLVMTRAPRQTYLALLYAPFFLIWKLWLYVRVLLGVERHGWIRTAREKL